MTENEFEELEKTHQVVANAWSSSTLSCVTILGNKYGTPVAMRYMSVETDAEFQYLKFDVPVTIDQK